MTKTGSMLRDKPTRSTIPMVAHMMTPGVVQIPGMSLSAKPPCSPRSGSRCPALIKDGEATFGIMTSGDIVKKVVAQGLEPHDVAVRDRSSNRLHSVECDQILDDATNTMASTGASLLIVTNGATGRHSDGTGSALAPKRCDTCLPQPFVSRTAREKARNTPRHHPPAQPRRGVYRKPHLLLPGTTIVLSFMLPGTDVSFSVRGTILNSGYEPEFHEDRGAIGTYPGVDIQFASPRFRRVGKFRAWFAESSAGHGPPLTRLR